jgi:ABC-2 type transport system permease protein
MTAALAIVGATLRQILGRKRLLLFGALAIFPGFIFFLNSSDGESSRATLQAFVDTANVHFSLAVPITALILSAAALGAERRDQTLSFIVLRPIPRLTIAASKLAAAFLAAIALNAAGALVLSLLYGVRGSEFTYVLPLMVGSAVATLVYAAVFVPLGYLSERSTLIGLAYVFVWENGIVGALGVLGVTSPWRIGYSAFAGLAPAEMAPRIDDIVMADLSMSAGTALIQTTVFVVASAALLTWILRRRDLV